MRRVQGIKAELPSGQEVDLLNIVVSSTTRANDLLNLATRYAEVHHSGKKNDN
jgi:hypothetical protein